MMTTAPKPVVLLISLEEHPWFEEAYASFLNQLNELATIQRAQTRTLVSRALSEDHPKAVLLTDGALTKRKFRQVWEEVLSYVRDGGTAVCMGLFSSFTRPPDFGPFFHRAGLPYEHAEYHRTTVILNQDSSVPHVARPFLWSSYSQKAVFLKNVPAADAWYAPNEDSVIESHVFEQDKIRNLDEVPVVFATVENGKLGYVGDVNGEQESHPVVLAMCGLYE